MVPVRLSCIALDAKCGRAALFTLRCRVVRILGSVPLAPDDPALLHQLFAHLMHAFPDCAAVSMQAFPRERQACLGRDPRHRCAIVHGWRACHAIALPATLPVYLAGLSAKKRYNLARQYRLLEQAAGILELKRIERGADVGELVDGIAAIVRGGGAPGSGRAADYPVLAAHRLLLSYVLKSGDDVVAVIAGSSYGDTWHVHQIHYAPRLRQFSAGAVALQCALQDVIAHFAFTSADFGFGEPRHRFASTHVLEERAHVLVTRRGSAARWLLAAFVRYDDAHAACVRLVRSLRSLLQRLLPG